MVHRPETNPASQDMLVGGVNPSEKYESQLGSLFPTEWKVIKFHGSKPPTSMCNLQIQLTNFIPSPHPFDGRRGST